MDKSNKFVIISTAYNKGKWIQFNVNSLKQQSYGNFIGLYGYDHSTDDTLRYLTNAIDGDPKFTIHHNNNPGSFLNCFMSTYRFAKQLNLIDPQDIIVEVDGDDWLLHPYVLQYLNQVYQDPKIWMTYGQYVHYPSGEVGGHFDLQLDDNVDRLNAYRQATFPYSHLKTYKAFLLDGISDSDITDPMTNRYFNAAGDFALCMPLVEQAGKARIFRVREPLYVYNVSDDLESESKDRLALQKDVEMRIRQIKPKNRI